MRALNARAREGVRAGPGASFPLLSRGRSRRPGPGVGQGTPETIGTFPSLLDASWAWAVLPPADLAGVPGDPRSSQQRDSGRGSLGLGL